MTYFKPSTKYIAVIITVLKPNEVVEVLTAAILLSEVSIEGADIKNLQFGGQQLALVCSLGAQYALIADDAATSKVLELFMHKVPAIP